MVTAVVIGSLNMDLVVRTAHMPAPGETVRGTDFATIPGGKGANQAAAIALLGASVAMVGHVGDDAFGPRLLDNMVAQGVATEHITAIPNVATGSAMIVVDEQGQNSIVIAAGANGQVQPRDIDAALPLLAQSRFLVLQLEIPLETVRYAIVRGHELGLEIVLNPAPAAPLPRDLLEQVTYLVPNETELQALAGGSTADIPSIIAAARSLQIDGAPTVIVTLGAQGALAITPEGTFQVPAPQVQVVDTTAAGDALIGGLLAGLSQERSLPEAVRYACCAGSLAVTKFGAQTSLPTSQAVQQLYQQHVKRHGPIDIS